MQPITNINDSDKFFGTTLNNNVSAKKSLLIFISPRKHYEISLRPIQYNFNAGTLDFIIEKAQQNESNLLNKDLHRQITNRSLTPSPIPTIFDMNYEFWTFCFIIEHNSMYQSLQLAPVKSIITGCCDDEPILDQNGKRVYNPKCRLIPTHMLQITILEQSIGASGLKVNKVTSTVDIISYIDELITQVSPVEQSTNSQPLYINTPDTMVDMIDVDEGLYQLDTIQSVVTVPPAEGSIQDQVVTKINSKANEPIKHTESIMKAISSAVIDTQGLELLPYAMKDSIVDSLSVMNLSRPTYNLVTDNIGSQLYMEYVITHFNPEISIVQIPRHQMLNTTDPSIATPNTVYSNLLSQLIPLYMVKYNLSCVALTYDSFTQSFNPDTMHMEFITVESPEMMKQKIDRFLMELKLDVFEIPKMYGDFAVNVMVNYIGDSFIDLRFYDYTMQPNGYFAQDMIFRPYGGMSLANFDTLANNATNLNSLITNLSSVFSGSI